LSARKLLQAIHPVRIGSRSMRWRRNSRLRGFVASNQIENGLMAAIR
jgi:hypothetical protein